MIFCEATTLEDLRRRNFPPQFVVLSPSDNDAEEKLRKVRGKEFGVEYRRGRSLRQHRLYFAVLRKVWENQEQFKSEDDLREATLIEIGFCELRERFDGSRYKVAKSMDFRLSQDEFQEKVFTPSIRLWCEHFGWQEEELV